MLLPQIVLYRKDPEFHELLGLACFHVGDFGSALSYLKRSREIAPDRIATLLGLALILVRRRKTTEAIRIWLDILEIEPSNKQAQRALALAKVLSEDDWQDLIEEKRYGSLLPKQKKLLLRRMLLPTIVIVTVVSIGIALFAFLINLSEPPYRIYAELLEFPKSEFSESDYSGNVSIVLNEAEIESKLTDIQRYYRFFRDNLVRYHGNMLLLSNASQSIKNQISLIITQLQEPDYTNFRDNFDYDQVIATPLLYNGVYVRWTGRVANVQVSEELIQFDLLVGFDRGRVVLGTVPVELEFAANLRGGESVEVIARVNSADGNLSLSATAIRQILGNQ